MDISEDVAEQYWEASANVFMHCYNQLIEPQRIESDVPAIPKALHERAKRIMRRAEFRRVFNKTAHFLKRFGTYAALLALICAVSVGTILRAEAEKTTVREVVASPFFQLVDDEWLISSSLISNYRYTGEIEETKINKEDPLKGMIPEGYVLVPEWQDTSERRFLSVYVHPDGGMINVEASELAGNTWIGALKAQHMAHISICGYPGIFVARENGVEVAFVCERSQQVFVLYASDLSKSETIIMTEEFAKNIWKKQGGK